MIPPARVLFVDDEEPILRALDRALRGGPHALFFTSDPLAAGDIVEREAIDVLVCDVVMPGKSGLAVMADVAAARPDVFRIMMTASTEREVVIRAINEAHVDRLLEKPWRLADLKEVLDEAVAIVRLKRVQKSAEPDPVEAIRAFGKR